MSDSTVGRQVLSARDVIERYYEYANRGDWELWLGLFSDDVVGDEQLPGHFSGIDFLRGVVDAIGKGYSKFKMYPQRVVVEGDAGCVIWRFDAANATGTPIGYSTDPKRPVIGANYFQIQNGKIVYLRTVHDPLPFKPFTDQLK
jgi:ketosteroid isomerase-like protein